MIRLEQIAFAVIPPVLDRIPPVLGRVVALGVIATLVVLTLAGVTKMSFAILLHEGSTIAVVLNALRLLAYGGSDRPRKESGERPLRERA